MNSPQSALARRESPPNANIQEAAATQPFLFQKREEVIGVVRIDPQFGEHSTYMGATQGGGADYDTD